MLTEKTNHAFSVILPLYNPSSNWVNLFQQNIKALNVLLPADVTVQYIIVYDGTPSPAVAASLDSICQSSTNISLITYPSNMGKGYALRQGVKMANTPYTLITDFDFPYKKNNIVDLVMELKKGSDIVIGKRAKSYFRQLPLKRKIISKACVLLNKLLLDLPLYDVQSGIKGFNEIGKEVFLQTTIDRFLIDTEFILRASKKPLSIKEINIELEPYVGFSNFGMGVIKTELNNFRKLIYLNKKLKRGLTL